MDDWVVVEVARSEPEAELLCSVLRGAGIECLLREGRMYQLVRQHDAVRERTLEITFLESGAEAYAFTFG